ncbi:MAG TPA: hypothetical protein VF281_02285 [Candidatus Saccharimonadales bacterium]
MLHRAIEYTQNDHRSDANLSLSNFYYQAGRSNQENYLKILKWTLQDEEYMKAADHVKEYIAKCLYSLDLSSNKETNEVFVKRTKNGYKIIGR